MIDVLGLVSAEQYENLQLALILMHHYQLSDFINKYSSVSSGIEHLDRVHFAKPHIKSIVNLIGKIANQVVSHITHCHI